MPIEGYAGSAAASMAAGAAVYMLKDDLGLGEVAESPAGTVRSLLASTSDEEIRSLGGVGGGGGGLAANLSAWLLLLVQMLASVFASLYNEVLLKGGGVPESHRPVGRDSGSTDM